MQASSTALPKDASGPSAASRRRVPGLSGVRAWWALSVLVCHVILCYVPDSQLGRWEFLAHGDYGVAGFLVLSGFLMAMNHGRDEIENPFTFLLHHVKKWYLLYLVTLLPWIFAWLRAGMLRDYIPHVITSLLLVQSWIPEHSYAISEVTWYLSCMAALYLLTPTLLRLLRLLKSNASKVIALVVCLALVHIIWDVNRVLYEHFLLRGLQYFSGMLAYELVKGRKVDGTALTAAVVAQVIAYGYLIPLSHVSALVDSVAAVLLVSVLYVGPSCALYDSSAVLSLSSVSLELYLIHYPVVTFVGDRLKAHMGWDHVLVQMCILAAMSIGASYAWSAASRWARGAMARRSERLAE